ncbi:MAG: molybdopterin molybdotransferase MoeA [Daejeonella sp.]|uniref:molybdopterin molybdotransferase MoeA n=1 Tax=Daejeonella sp. TaxID=2805397 RepID=UPI002734ABB2|nr:gephyrin-like molybdotransferase Glp [Daejeonella sp.]MDP3469333.1 molybdopterin molybdotransferase MoeA [Daejeonella sp.]
MPAEFIEVSEALKMIRENIKSPDPIKISISSAAGLILAEDIYSLRDVPPFNQSSMDGYALNFEGYNQHNTLKIQGLAQAGLAEQIPLQAQNTCRIFTGAAVPPGADTVVMQEKVDILDGKLIIKDSNILAGQNVRIQGSEAKKGELALEKGSLLNAAAIGFLAGLGIHELMVYPMPTISIILTGNELQQPGLPLSYGQVYESNSYALRAAIREMGILNVDVFSAEDDLKILTEVLAIAMQQSDLVLLTGGVSVGDYDFVIRAAEANGVEQVFHKIRQKPGKPIYFGKKGDRYIFGLPGNPASVLTCFYEYVYPAIELLSKREKDLIRMNAILETDIKKSAGLTQFLKAYFDGKTVKDLKAQESFRLSSFAKANCLIKLDEDRIEYKAGEEVEIHLLPSF